MARRHHITIGAHTSAGGTVVSGSGMMSIDGKAIALEGDKISCPSCQQGVGTIICIGPRHPETLNGKPVALEGDLCACGCTPHPTLLPNQGRRFQEIDTSMAAAFKASQSSTIPAVKAEKHQTAEFDQYFHLTDEKGNPVREAMIDLHLPDGRMVSQQTDSHGKTDMIDGQSAHEISLSLYQKGEH